MNLNMQLQILQLYSFMEKQMDNYCTHPHLSANKGIFLLLAPKIYTQMFKRISSFDQVLSLLFEKSWFYFCPCLTLFANFYCF